MADVTSSSWPRSVVGRRLLLFLATVCLSIVSAMLLLPTVALALAEVLLGSAR